MTRVYSFPPIAGDAPETLILGSMPGVASLEAGQYYAHPRNQFWPIICRLLGAGAVPADYASRAALLTDNRIALWDVLAACIRPGSLDSAIAAEIPNDLPGFLAGHSGIRRICFNGRKAESSFRTLVLPRLDAVRYELCGLPSTSPANASYGFERKYGLWADCLK